MKSVAIELATADDAEVAVSVLRDSIRNRCQADHRNDRATLDLWLKNKTIENFLRWLSNPDVAIMVARVDDRVRGVGSVHAVGEIRLCYVQPRFGRHGLGTSILKGLEDRAVFWGISEPRLNSSRTALTFYERHGYRRTGEPMPGFGVSTCYPCAKVLTR